MQEKIKKLNEENKNLKQEFKKFQDYTKKLTEDQDNSRKTAITTSSNKIKRTTLLGIKPDRVTATTTTISNKENIENDKKERDTFNFQKSAFKDIALLEAQVDIFLVLF